MIQSSNRGINLKMERASIFIDGGYSNRILKSYFATPDIDYEKLSDNICKQLQLKRLRTYYYTCMPLRRKGNENDEMKYNNMQRFLTNLRRLPRFEVKLGELQMIGGQFRQKMVDLLMSLDIIDCSSNKQIQHIIILAGDADFVPAIKRAKGKGVIVHLFYHPSSVHNQILDEVDELHVIDKELIDKCKKQLK